MSTVLESLTKKLEVLGEGKIYEYTEKNNEDEFFNTLWILNPKEYKDFFILEDIGIQKTLKSVVLETVDSACNIYYILDSSVLLLSLEMSFQPLEVTKEVPISLIAYLRILCSKKASIEIAIYSDRVLVHFEDTIVKDKDKPKVKLKKGEKKETLIGKRYTLELPLQEVNILDKEVLEYIDSFSVSGVLVDKFPILVNLDSFGNPEIELPLIYYEITNDRGSFKIVYGGKLNIWYIECPTEIAKNYISIKSIEPVEYTDKDIEEMISDFSYEMGEEEDDTN